MLFFCVLFRLTTYLTIDRFGAHGNNGYKTAKENFVWNRNGYKKAFVAERTFLTLFGTQRSWVQIPSPRPKPFKSMRFGGLFATLYLFFEGVEVIL